VVSKAVGNQKASEAEIQRLSQVSYSKVEIEKLNKEIEKLKHEITEKEKEIGDMRAKYASARLPATSPAGQQEEDQQLAAYKQATDSKLLDYQQKITSLQEQLNESMEANTQHLQEISVTRQQQLEKVRQVVSKAVGNQKASEAEIQRLKQELAQLKTGNGTVAASSDNATILKLQEQLTLLKANYDLLLEENTLMKGEPAPFLY
jgi:chromosome segregation ATPase